jgi:hypothetical protein
MKKNLFQNLKPVSLTDMIGSDFGSIDLSDSLGGIPGTKQTLFLKKFTPDDLMKIMGRVGLMSHLKKKGFTDIIIKTDVDATQINYLKVYDRVAEPDHLLIDLRLSETKFVPDKKFFIDERDIVTYDMVIIEWLSAQNPVSSFNGSKPQLPGQARPGLGVLKYCFDMMYTVASDVTKDGFLDVPDHAHGAIMYSKKFKFFDPRHEGVLRAILRDLKKHTISDISWGIITGTVIDTYKNIPHKYNPSEQIFYISQRMRNYFHSKNYTSIMKKYFKIKKFTLDYDEMVRRRNEILKTKAIDEL